jgi:hypothetical protein
MTFVAPYDRAVNEIVRAPGTVWISGYIEQSSFPVFVNNLFDLLKIHCPGNDQLHFHHVAEVPAGCRFDTLATATNMSQQAPLIERSGGPERGARDCPRRPRR